MNSFVIQNMVYVDYSKCNRCLLYSVSTFCRNHVYKNNVDCDQILHYVASDLGLHCLTRHPLWDA